MLYIMHTLKVQENFFLALIDDMGNVRIKIQEIASQDDLQRWEDHMLEKAKCWNKFCLGLYDEHELRAVHVEKEEIEDNISYLTTLCEDCIKATANYGILVNEKHLIVETQRKE